jgi:hypothetical protein
MKTGARLALPVSMLAYYDVVTLEAKAQK